MSIARRRSADWTPEDAAILDRRYQRTPQGTWASLFWDYRDADYMLELSRLRGLAPAHKGVALRLIRAQSVDGSP